MRFVQGSAGSCHSLALDSEGKAWSWGRNDFGVLGIGTHAADYNDRTTDRDVPTAVVMPEGVRVCQVSAGSEHSLALDIDGNVWAWGFNDFGQLGNGTCNKDDGHDFSADKDVPIPALMPNKVTFRQIRAGYSYSLALDMNGNAWAWGRNEFGQLGNGTHGVTGDYERANRYSPTAVWMSSDVSFTDIEAGGWHSLAYDSSGNLYVWGLNYHGRLGLGDHRDRCVPTAIFSSVGYVE